MVSGDGLQQSASGVLPGSARLAVVAPVALVSFFYANVLDYCLPLYCEVRETLPGPDGSTYSNGIWLDLMLYRLTPWIIGPMLAGLLTRFYGERRVWCAALIGKTAIPFTLAMHPPESWILPLAIWQGLTGVMMWISGISLIQMVAPEKKGLANGALFTSMGIGSVLGPACGRLLLYRGEFGALWTTGTWTDWGRRVLNFDPIEAAPALSDFEPVFWLLLCTTCACGVAIGGWGQRPGRFPRDTPASFESVFSDVMQLCRTPKYLALVCALCLFGGAVFGASNYYLKFRAEDLGLITAAGVDAGWIWLVLLKTFMWIPGGFAVGLLAGRRAPGLAAVIMVGSFGLGAAAIGGSHAAWQLFAAVALFEFTRQFMRWSHGGYMTEHLETRLRPIAIGFAISFSGTGEVLYGFLTKLIWNPDLPNYESWKPVSVAGVLGLIAAAGLYVFDRVRPIRGPDLADGTRPAETVD